MSRSEHFQGYRLFYVAGMFFQYGLIHSRFSFISSCYDHGMDSLGNLATLSY